MEVRALSETYEVRKLTEKDIRDVYDLCSGNTLYYEYCPPFVTEERIRADMMAVPSGFPASDKYFIGFYEGERLTAVMDLLDGYPEKSTAYIGFFMVARSVQKNGVGTAIIDGVCKALKGSGVSAVRLAWVKGNPQAEHFWLKNRFVTIKETCSTAAESVILAERRLQPEGKARVLF